VRRRIGAAVGDGPWLDDASVTDNLALPLRVHGEDERAVGAVVGEFLDWLGLGDRREAPVAALSTGERRLLDVARAAVVRPDLLLLDEPLAGLDGRTAGRVAQLVGELAGLGAAVVVATAEADTARRLGCEAVTLTEGGLKMGAAPLRAAS
jgi:cell division transport system ATP-binding protein